MIKKIYSNQPGVLKKQTLVTANQHISKSGLILFIQQLTVMSTSYINLFWDFHLSWCCLLFSSDLCFWPENLSLFLKFTHATCVHKSFKGFGTNSWFAKLQYDKNYLFCQVRLFDLGSTRAVQKSYKHFEKMHFWHPV